MRPPAPGVFDGAATTVTVLVLLIEFGMLRAALLRSQVRLYAAQSLVVSMLAGIVAAAQHVPELYVLAVLSFALKVVVVPWVVLRLVRQAHAEIAGSASLKVASAVLVAIVVGAFGFFAIGALHIRSTVLPATALAVSVAIVLVAFVLMVVRGDVVSQAVGFFSLENGISLASLVVATGLPLILEVAFLFDLLVAVVVFAVLIRVHHDQRASLSTSDLTELRG